MIFEEDSFSPSGLEWGREDKVMKNEQEDYSRNLQLLAEGMKKETETEHDMQEVFIADHCTPRSLSFPQ